MERDGLKFFSFCANFRRFPLLLNPIFPHLKNPNEMGDNPMCRTPNPDEPEELKVQSLKLKARGSKLKFFLYLPNNFF